MMTKLIGAAILLGLLLTFGEAKRRYDLFKVIEVIPTTQSHLELLDALEDNLDLGLDFWIRGNLNRSTQILVPPQGYAELKRQLQDAGMTVTVINQNIQVLLNEEDNGRQLPGSPDIHNQFLDYDQAMDWLTNFTATHSSLMKMGVMGVTETKYHRVLSQITITNGDGEGKPTIWIESLTHAREWATLSTVLNLIEWLGEGYGSDPDATAILDKYDVEINPIGNPDGYANTFTVDRFWRKNAKVESLACEKNHGFGNGVDLNRNWDNHWNTTGASSDPCHVIYQGVAPLSEAELSSFVAAMERTPEALRKAFIPIHAYSQMIFVPYSWTTEIKPINYEELLRVANAAAEAIRKFSGAIFKVGAVGDFWSTSGGSSGDYAVDSLHFEYNIEYELYPGISSSLAGFMLNRWDIVKAFEDFKVSFIAIAEEMH